MQTANRIALKEWAAVCAALDSGEQILLLRKGGIDEGPAGFRPEHDQFWLLPTDFHQAAEGLSATGQALLEQSRQQLAEGTLRVAHYATVHDVLWVGDERRLESLAQEHVWSADAVQRRFHYRSPGLHLLVVRVYRLDEAWELADSPDIAGCRSWVDLGQELSTKGATPVLDSQQFAERCVAIHEALEASTAR